MKRGLFLLTMFFLAVAIFASSGIFDLSILQAQTIAGESIDAREKRLRSELKQTEKEIVEWRKVLTEKQGETASLARDTAILNAKIQEAKLVIKARNLAIETLGKDIGEKEKTIFELEGQIVRSKDALSELIRKTNEVDSYSVVEMALSNEDISEFFSDLDSFDSIKRSLHELLADVRDTKTQNETEKKVLSTKKSQETDARVSVETEKRLVEQKEAEKKALLNISRNQEKGYAQALAEREKKAAQIRSALFSLRDTAAIPFGTALQYANEVSKKTGVRPAFLLAILTQESNLGQNVGQCLVTDFVTGDGIGKNTGTPFLGIMKPTRDITPFLAIADRLGFDPKSRPVSCPQPGGYGGGMGPSQFIPSTWVSLEGRIASLINKSTPDPWQPRDAFFASALYLSDLGAGAGGYTAESTAAAKYYAGGYWQTRGMGYAASVLKHATNIQENMINPLEDL